VGQRTVDQHRAQGKNDQRGIPELDLIITANGFQAVGMLIVQPQG
jgi:hypothetical protein